MEIHEINLNDYKVTQTIRQGQFGIVFLVVDEKKKKKKHQFAAKIENRNFENQSSLMTEMRTYYRVNNPEILKLLGYSSHDFDFQPRLVLITDFMQNC